MSGQTQRALVETEERRRRVIRTTPWSTEKKVVYGIGGVLAVAGAIYGIMKVIDWVKKPKTPSAVLIPTLTEEDKKRHAVNETANDLLTLQDNKRVMDAKAAGLVAAPNSLQVDVPLKEGEWIQSANRQFFATQRAGVSFDIFAGTQPADPAATVSWSTGQRRAGLVGGSSLKLSKNGTVRMYDDNNEVLFESKVVGGDAPDFEQTYGPLKLMLTNEGQLVIRGAFQAPTDAPIKVVAGAIAASSFGVGFEFKQHDYIVSQGRTAFAQQGADGILRVFKGSNPEAAGSVRVYETTLARSVPMGTVMCQSHVTPLGDLETVALDEKGVSTLLFSSHTALTVSNGGEARVTILDNARLTVNVGETTTFITPLPLARSIQRPLQPRGTVVVRHAPNGGGGGAPTVVRGAQPIANQQATLVRRSAPLLQQPQQPQQMIRRSVIPPQGQQPQPQRTHQATRTVVAPSGRTVIASAPAKRAIQQPLANRVTPQ